MRQFIAAGLVLHCLLSTVAAAPTANLSAKPNLVFILADDLGWGELGCYGQEKIPTPHLDQLARQGMRFTRHYSGAPVCAPSRCVLMTGKHLGHAEIRGNMQAKVKFPEFSEGQYPLSADVVTFPMLFQKAGYVTGAMGKWGLGPVGSTGEPNRKGFELFFGYNCQAVAHSYYPPYLWRNREQLQINKKPIPGHSKQPEGVVKLEDWQSENYAPRLMIAEAEAFIAKNKVKPFMLYLPFIEPHVAMHPPAESVNRFPNTWDEQVYRGANGYLPHPRPRAAYAAMISDLDSYVGRVMKALEIAGVADNTLIVFSSDNGSTMPNPNDARFHAGGADPKFFNSTAGLRGYKGSVYEGGIRVPLIARWPGKIPPGKVNDSPSYFADWFPTLCEIFQLDSKPDLDGESLWRTLKTGEIQRRQRPMIWVFPESGGQIAVQIDQWKAIRKNLKTKKPGSWELYDLEKDRGERQDVATYHQDVIKQVEAILHREISQNLIFPVPIPGLPMKN